MADGPSTPREDIEAAIEARRELGSESEPFIVDSFLERIEQRVARRQPAAVERRGQPAAGAFVLALVSLGAGIPLTAIAVTNGGLAALLVVWVGIVLVNVSYGRLR